MERKDYNRRGVGAFRSNNDGIMARSLPFYSVGFGNVRQQNAARLVFDSWRKSPASDFYGSTLFCNSANFVATKATTVVKYYYQRADPRLCRKSVAVFKRGEIYVGRR